MLKVVYAYAYQIKNMPFYDFSKIFIQPLTPVKKCCIFLDIFFFFVISEIFYRQKYY